MLRSALWQCMIADDALKPTCVFFAGAILDVDLPECRHALQ